MRGGVKMGFSFLRRIGNLSGPVYAPANLQPNTAPRAEKKRRTPEGVRHFNIHDAAFQ